jgi:hypothetical protein
MQIDDDMDHLLDDKSLENRYEEEQYGVDGDSTVYDPTLFGLEEQNSASQSDEVQQVGAARVTPVFDPAKKKAMV